MKTEQHPPQRSSLVIASMYDEGLQPHPQLYEFMTQPHYHQEDYGYNLYFFNASGEDFMSNLIGTNLQTLEYAYVYMQCIFIPFFASFHQRIMFECPSDHKVITISEDISLDTLRKIIFDANEGCKILINLFYYKPIYIGDGSVEYDIMQLKHNDDVGKYFSSIHNLVPKVVRLIRMPLLGFFTHLEPREKSLFVSLLLPELFNLGKWHMNPNLGFVITPYFFFFFCFPMRYYVYTTT
ncbi:hypothetical protein GmHk_20G057684 [Glycine max]|nr:hypothetical protein GmHk_20G057684 [Glycine max]